MQRIAKALSDSIVALKKQPFLFLPKIILAVLWGLFLIYTMKLFLQLTQIQQLSLESATKGLYLQKMDLFWSDLTLLLAALIVLFIIDTIVNACYPLLIYAFYKKQKLGFWSALKIVLKNAFKFVPPIIASFAVSVLIVLPFVFFLSYAIASNDLLGITIWLPLVLIMVFVVSILMYFVAPIAVIERKGMGSLKKSVFSGAKNFKPISLGVLITYVLSIITAVIAALGEQLGLIGAIGLIVFILLRILTALLATYSVVLNPVLYLEYEKKMNLENNN